MSRKFFIILAILILGCTGVIIWYIRSSAVVSPIPKDIQEKAAFSIFYPINNIDGVDPEHSTISYNDTNDALAYTVLVNGQKVVVTEQTTPEVFSESGVYSYKLNQAHEYYSFNSSSGEIDLTKPSGADNQTVAWDNDKGTLLLATGTQSLSNTQWQNLFNNMGVFP